MYAARLYILGDQGKPVSAADDTAAKCMSAAVNFVSLVPRIDCSRSEDADTMLAKRMDDNKQMNPGLACKERPQRESCLSIDFISSQKVRKSSAKLGKCKIGIRGKIVAKNKLHSFSHIPLSGSIATTQARL